ncbi:MAG: type VI secretion system protein TssA [Pseudomonadales bacterium]|nr:type VI secretion system protein TssA [Pseudomonadales bacterium]
MSHPAEAVAETDAQQSETDNPLKKAATLVEAHWVSIATQSVEANAPAGSNCRLDDDFERIELEIAKLDSLTNDEPIEWELLSQWCKEILETKSKDLLVVCYLTRALCEFQLLDGLLIGSFISLQTIERFWDSCFPPKKRKKGRAAAYEWLSERCQPLVEKQTFNVGHIDRLTLVVALLTELDQQLLDRLDSDAPAITELTNPLKRALVGLIAEKKAKERNSTAPVAKSPPANSQPSRTATPAKRVDAVGFDGSISSEKDLQNCYRNTQDSLRAACDFLRSENLGDPEAYRINRFLTWLGVSQLPPDSNGITQLRPPAKEKLQHYQGLVASGKHQELIPEVENSVSRAPYWLDGHRLVAESLESCGFSDAASEVAIGVTKFVEKFPKVIELKFSDQSDFADNATKQWIKLSTQSASTNSNQEIQALPIEETNQWEIAYQEALQLLREKQKGKAFALFQVGCKQSYSKRELTFWRYYQARFCYETQQPKLAVGLLESMLRNLDELRVNDWEPDVTAKIIELLIRCYQLYSDKEIPKERVATLHERLCQFDLATAYELSTH